MVEGQGLAKIQSFKNVHSSTVYLQNERCTCQVADFGLNFLESVVQEDMSVPDSIVRVDLEADERWSAAKGQDAS